MFVTDEEQATWGDLLAGRYGFARGSVRVRIDREVEQCAYRVSVFVGSYDYATRRGEALRHSSVVTDRTLVADPNEKRALFDAAVRSIEQIITWIHGQFTARTVPPPIVEAADGGTIQRKYRRALRLRGTC